MPDSSGSQCYECNHKFTTFRRRHHCRLCGQIFCRNCSSVQVKGFEMGYHGVLRLCSFCANQVRSHARLRTAERRPNRVNSFTQLEIDRDRDWPALSIETGGGSTVASKEPKKEVVSHSQPSGKGELGLEQPAPDRSPLADPPLSSSTAPSLASSPPEPADPLGQLQGRVHALFVQKAAALLDSLLRQEHLDPEGRWRGLLWSLSALVADRVGRLVLAAPDALNPLDFLHIKKVLVESEPGFEVVNGVAFSKTLAHTGMPASMRNASLMLLSGTIAYERVLEKFTSLETVLAQENQHLRLQCDRVLSRRANLLLCQNSVPTAAVDILLAEGVSLVADVKREVLLRVAKATGADILGSLDAHFLQPRMGFAADFNQRTFRAPDGHTKSILVLEGCVESNPFGPTVLLKGRCHRELLAAKRILRFLVLARHSSRLEMAFLSMFNTIPKELSSEYGGRQADNAFVCPVCEMNSRSDGRREQDGDGDQLVSGGGEQSRQQAFIRALGRVQLGHSPAILISPPYLLSEEGGRCPLLPFLRNSLPPFLLPEELERQKADWARLRTRLKEADGEQQSHWVANGRQFRHNCLDPSAVAQPRKLLAARSWADFRSTSALYFRRRMEENTRAMEQRLARVDEILGGESGTKGGQMRLGQGGDMLSPYGHQSITFLYCANSRKNGNSKAFCMGPFVLNRPFYAGKDTSLGGFLLSNCFNPEYSCRACGRPMQEHLRRIVHRNSRVEISTHPVGAGGGPTPLTSPFGAPLLGTSGPAANKDQDGLNFAFPLDDLPSAIPNSNCQNIICWLRCPSCSANSSIVPMPDEVFHLSFAKFVDYLSNGAHWVSPFPSSIDLRQCLHCSFHSHIHFFALGTTVVCFRVHPIYPLNVLFSPIPCSLGDGIGPLSDKDQGQELGLVSIRDSQDAKGALAPDIGSIIAHALGSEQYRTGKSQREPGADWLELAHSEDGLQYTVKIYFAEQFEQFRSLVFSNGESQFVQSLSTSTPWYPQGGKSGATFFRTEDERFVLKTLSRFEMEAFRNCALNYIDYVCVAAKEKKLTALCKIFGVYSINFTNKQTGQCVKNADYLVMEYLFYKKDIKQVWDLKGSLRNRFASNKPATNGMNTDSSPTSSVLLDENYMQNLWSNQFYVNPHSKEALNRAIVNDSHFLSGQQIMDYSLLAGISRGQEDEMIIGIVDYMRTFTVDKKLESVVKSALPISNTPTVIQPSQYCTRFHEAIHNYFAVAPDQWTCEESF